MALDIIKIQANFDKFLDGKGSLLKMQQKMKSAR